MKKFTYSDQKACKQVQQPLQQEVKKLELKCDVPSVLFSFNQENKSSKEKNGFLNRRPIQIKSENLHEGVFWLSKKNRDIIKSKILKIKEDQELRRSPRIKRGKYKLKATLFARKALYFHCKIKIQTSQRPCISVEIYKLLFRPALSWDRESLVRFLLYKTL